MKALVTALTLAAALIAAPAFVRSAQVAPANDRGDAAGQSHGGTYQGYPLTDWNRTDSSW